MAGANVFIVVPGESSRQGIVIGKNSNRPPNEVQELVYEKNGDSEVKCTFKTVVAGKNTMDVILSKPVNIWGCEMGANDADVVGVTVDHKDSNNTGLIPQDILRLALERGTDVVVTVELIGELIAEHGEDTPSAYLVADKSEAWYVEGVGRAWVAERLGVGVRVLPPLQHIGVDYHKSAGNLEALAKEKGWDGVGKVQWNEIFLKKADDDKQASAEKSIIEKYFQDISDFGVKQMTQVLRDVDLRISRGASDSTPTAASQVSVLPAQRPACHWFTATPDPTLSVFKPFIFSRQARISALTKCPPGGDGKHQLYRLHESATASGENKVITLLQEMERDCLNEVDIFMFDGAPEPDLSEVHDLLKDCVEAEVKFYK